MIKRFVNFAFSFALGMALAVLLAVIFSSSFSHWVVGILGGEKKEKIVEFIVWGIVEIFVFWGLVMVGGWIVAHIENIKLSWEKVKTIGRRGWQERLFVFLWVVGSLGVALFAVLILVMFNECVECWAKEVLGLGRKRDTIQFVGLGIAGVLAIFGAVAVNRRAAAQVENNELIEKGHIQERFKTAIKHLGNKDDTVRIASFYEFSHLARDNSNLRENIFDIMCAHLRQKTADKEYQKKEGHTEEVQSLLNVLFQSKGSQDEPFFAKFNPDLRKIFLMRANLQKANLQRADLWGANLFRVDLRGAYLQNADLQWANLEYADLQDADLEYADLQRADLRNANLERVKNLKTAKLSGTKVKDATPPEGFQWPKDVNRD